MNFLVPGLASGSSWSSCRPRSTSQRCLTPARERALRCRAACTTTEAVASSSRSAGQGTLIKMCGVVCPEDAELVAAAGADFIGMIMCPKAKRAIQPSVARAIAAVARKHGAQAVGVFVEEDADTIARTCTEAQLDLAQLHGAGAREALARLPHSLGVIYVMHADSQGRLQTPAPAEQAGGLGSAPLRPVDWVLVDGMVGGSGEAYNWANLRPPTGVAQQGWFLAGGLGPGNVADAVDAQQPTGVDVSSGITCADKLRKDAAKVHAFVSAVRRHC